MTHRRHTILSDTHTHTPSRYGTSEHVVEKLDAHIVGQAPAKRSVAVALRDRWRRQQLLGGEDDYLRDEIYPTNILMSGPTGTGKSEIARRLANIAGAPLVKAVATKYTEVGIHGSNSHEVRTGAGAEAGKSWDQEAPHRWRTGAGRAFSSGFEVDANESETGSWVGRRM